MKPQFEHDCTKCRLIAVSLTHDYYTCTDSMGYRVVLRRYGNEDSQIAFYNSRWGNADVLPWVAWAMELVQELEAT